MKKMECLRCGKSWNSILDRLPKQCRHCHSPYWNKPRERAKNVVKREKE